MNGHNLDFDTHYPVITDWDDLKKCPFEKGDFLRVYCDHDLRWCDAEFGYDCCQICTDHLNE